MGKIEVVALVDRFARLGVNPDDPEDICLQKTTMVRGNIMFILAGLVWGIVYVALGETKSALIPLSYAIISTISVAYFCINRRYPIYRFSQLFLILILPFLLMISLGGFINSSAVILWSLLSPLGALMFSDPCPATRWFMAFLGLVILSGFLQVFARTENHLPPQIITAFFVGNIGAVSAIVFVLLRRFMLEKDQALKLLAVEQDRSERLLLNVLPKDIAARLKAGGGTIADHFDCASVLFADLEGFTPLTAELAPVEMVELLNEVYSHFDALVEKHDLEKIRTIGDNYMVASGVPRRRPDHAQVLARLALEMCAYLCTLPPRNGKQISFRMGINSGPVIAGVIGRKKFAYDLWGDTVNTASRMESHGVGGKIQITRSTYELIKDEFICVPRGRMSVKGKGELDTWFLEGINLVS